MFRKISDLNVLALHQNSLFSEIDTTENETSFKGKSIIQLILLLLLLLLLITITTIITTITTIISNYYYYY